MQNIETRIKGLHILAQNNNGKYIKDKKQISYLTESTK